MSSKIKDYYKMLGIPRNANNKEIKTAYQRLKNRQIHPASLELPNKEIDLGEIQEAYEILCDKGLRKLYDEVLEQSEEIQIEQELRELTNYRELGFDPDNIDWYDSYGSPSYFPPHQVDDVLDITVSHSQAKMGGLIHMDIPSYFGLGFCFSNIPRRRFNLTVPAQIKNKEIKEIYVPELDYWIRVRFSIL
jgi:curved DNA-binding protein CbpA